MKTKSKIEKTLESLDHIRRADAPKELKGEILQKIRFIREIHDPWFKRLKYGVAAMIAMAILNGIILINNYRANQSEESQIEYLATEWFDENEIIVYDYELQ